MVFSTQLPFGKLTEPGPGMFPFSLSLLLLISGILIFIHGKGKVNPDPALKRGALGSPQIFGIHPCDKSHTFKKVRDKSWGFLRGGVKAAMGGGGLKNQLVTPLQIVGLTLIFSILLEKLGYLVTTLAYLFILFIWICRYKFWIAAGLAIVLGMGSWYFFAKLLVIRLPAGILNL